VFFAGSELPVVNFSYSHWPPASHHQRRPTQAEDGTSVKLTGLAILSPQNILFRGFLSTSISVQKAARYSIPQGFRPTYTPCLDEECQDLLKQYEVSSDRDIADHLIESLDAARRHSWEELTSQINFTHSSWKSWAPIHRLDAAQQPPKSTHPSVSANAIAAHLIQVAKAPQ